MAKLKNTFKTDMSITASPEFREAERLYSKARHDEAQALHHAKLEGRQEGMIEGMQKGKIEGAIEKAYAIAKNLLQENFPIEAIVAAAGLSKGEVGKLRGLG